MIFKNKLLKLVVTTLKTIAIGTIIFSTLNYINKETFKSSEKLQKEIELKSSKITTKNQLISDLNNFNPNLNNNNPVIYALDSDNKKTDDKHGSNTIETIYGLIDSEKIKNSNINYVSLLLSSNRFNLKDELNNKKLIYNNLKDDNEKQKFKDNNLEFNILDFYQLAYEKTPNNPVIINQSFAFNPNSKEKVFNSTESIEFIQNVNTYNSNLINALKEYKNLYLSISAGNNDLDFLSSKVDNYNNKLLKYSNNNFDKYKTLTKNLNNLIISNTILNNESINKLNKKLKENKIIISINELKELVNESIVDYLNNFEKTDLVNQLNQLNYADYKNLEGRVMIVESISLIKFRDNINQKINLLDKLPKEIVEFYNKISILDLNNFHLNKEEIAEFQNIIDKYSKIYPELFLINNYGSNSNLENRIKSNFIEIAPLYPNTNSSFILGYSGTSSGAAIITAKTTNKLMEEKEIKLENGINRELSSF